MKAAMKSADASKRITHRGTVDPLYQAAIRVWAICLSWFPQLVDSSNWSLCHDFRNELKLVSYFPWRFMPYLYRLAAEPADSYLHG
ncbi:MAG: hypothetical protein R3D97_05885 [Paracoccaceae bacterium]